MGHGREGSVVVGRKNFINVESCPKHWGCLYYLPWAIDTLMLITEMVPICCISLVSRSTTGSETDQDLDVGEPLERRWYKIFAFLGTRGTYRRCVQNMESNVVVEFGDFHPAHPYAVTFNVKTSPMRKRVWTSRLTSRYSRIHLHVQSFTLLQPLWRSSSSSNPKTTT